MAEFLMPSLGSDMETGTVAEWLVAPGETVERNQVIVVIETTKGAIDVEIFENGIIDELLVPVGKEVPVGEPLALYHRPGESPASRVDTPTRDAQVTAAPEKKAVAVIPAGERSMVRISPAARQRAQELGIDTGRLSGSGPQGSIVLADVERAAAGSGAGAKPVAEAHPPAPAIAMRQTIAAAMARSKREIPHYYLATHICLNRTLVWLESENARRPVDERLIPAAVLYRAVVRALQAVPELNGHWSENGARLSNEIHLGIVVSLRKRGLIIPALLNAERMSLVELMKTLQDVTDRARTGRLRASELSAATISVTNLGDRGVDTVYPVIYPPQLAIVGFGRMGERVVVEEGKAVVRPMITATLAGDHRASDGYHGTRFLNEVDKYLQVPEQL